MYKPKVYTASKLRYAKLWRDIRSDPDWDFVQWTASWPDSPEVFAENEGVPPEPEVFRDGWTKDLLEVRFSDFILLYAKDDENLRGALIECGFAIANGVSVVTVGIFSDTHTWTYLPHVNCFASLRDARQHLYKFTTMAPPKVRGRRERDDE